MLGKPRHLAIVLAALAPLGAEAAGPAYQITDLSPTAPGGAYALAINNAGTAAGYIDPQVSYKYTDWTPVTFSGGATNVLNNIPGTIYGLVNGINDAGLAVGWSTTRYGPVPGVTHAALFTGSRTIDLGGLPGCTDSEALAINAAGDAVGDCGGRAILFSHGAVIDLGALSPGEVSAATAINNRGQAVGYGSAQGQIHALLFANGIVTSLGVLPGGSYSEALGINDLGQAVGFADLPSGDLRAVLFENGTVRPLDTAALPPGGFSFAYGINNSGQIAGSFYGNAVLYQNGTSTLLPVLPGCVFSNAYAINERGEIAGACSFAPQGGFEHAVTWTLAHQFIPPHRPLM
jgi:probable HAF family extracellular repeat protein